MNQIKCLSHFLFCTLSLGRHICILSTIKRDYYFATFTKSNNVLFFLFCNFRHHPKIEGETNFALCRNRKISHMRIKLMQEDFLVSNGMEFDLNQNVALEQYYVFILREKEN